MLAENEDLRKDLKINFIGKTDYSVVTDLEKFHLMPYVTKTEYLPQSQTTEAMQASQILLLALNNTPNSIGVISGKLFEYMAAGRPILAIGKENGDAARIIHETKAGAICDFEDKKKMKEMITRLYEQFKQKNLSASSSTIAAYSRRVLTEKLAQLLKKLPKEARSH